MMYAVIGGQYNYHCYGVVDTLYRAKTLATRNGEYWDNWQGWNVPKIYDLADCIVDGDKVIPNPDKQVKPIYHKIGLKWEKVEY